ncbi:hypothetical protein OE88DRAFT_65997 [Heliocybe sulcata]|uniref:F-box domain-containing protein n=1 Tax=Heliocybe sulcata TaxID=5364 RepID=A0A5C3NJ53_9AGAM|nr:hypothetical protein OE88DRAFT_65997 [Heliocybe sulcata]
MLDFARDREEQRRVDQEIRTLNSRRSALAPISSLPTELLSMVFEACCFESGGAITITHVCHHWRATAVGIPGLWRSPLLSRLECTKEFIRRAKGAPLDITVTFDDSDTADKMQAIELALDQLDHIEVLRLYVRTRRPDMHTMERLAKPAPLLKDVEIYNVNIFTRKIALFDGVTPALECVAFIYYNFAHGRGLNIIQNLKTLALVQPMDRPSKDEMVSLLEGSPLLEFLDLDQCTPAGYNISDITPVPLHYLQDVEVHEKLLIQCATMLVFLKLSKRPRLHLSTLLPSSASDLHVSWQIIDSVLAIDGAPPFKSGKVVWEGLDRFTISAWSTPDVDHATRGDFSLLFHRSTQCTVSHWCQYLPLSGAKTLELDGVISMYSSKDLGWLMPFKRFQSITVLRASRVAVQEMIEVLGAHLMHEWDYMEGEDGPEEEEVRYGSRVGCRGANESDEDDETDSEDAEELSDLEEGSSSGSFSAPVVTTSSRSIASSSRLESSGRTPAGTFSVLQVHLPPAAQKKSSPSNNSAQRPMLFPNLLELTVERYDLRTNVMRRSVSLVTVLARVVEDRATSMKCLDTLCIKRCSGVMKPHADRLQKHVGTLCWTPAKKQ